MMSPSFRLKRPDKLPQETGRMCWFSSSGTELCLLQFEQRSVKLNCVRLCMPYCAKIDLKARVLFLECIGHCSRHCLSSSGSSPWKWKPKRTRRAYNCALAPYHLTSSDRRQSAFSQIYNGYPMLGSVCSCSSMEPSAWDETLRLSPSPAEALP